MKKKIYNIMYKLFKSSLKIANFSTKLSTSKNSEKLILNIYI